TKLILNVFMNLGLNSCGQQVKMLRGL
ncbi:MAG: hypothetical protein QOI22_257, partial [Verrucomicrobiota bacterium]